MPTVDALSRDASAARAIDLAIRGPLGREVSPMLFTESELKGAYFIDLERHLDDRGFFARSFCEREFSEHGLDARFPQCNLSHNRSRGTLRGMHFEAPPSTESKLVRCVRGAIHDVIVDLREASPTYLEWTSVVLSEENGRALFLPARFAHGFITLVDQTDVLYHMGDFFRPEAARGFRFDDPRIGIRWPLTPTVISTRDAAYPDFAAPGPVRPAQ